MLREGAIINYRNNKLSAFSIMQGGYHTGLKSCYGIQKTDKALKLRHLQLKSLNVKGEKSVEIN